jgi:predicted transcriptional regulator
MKQNVEEQNWKIKSIKKIKTKQTTIKKNKNQIWYKINKMRGHLSTLIDQLKFQERK